MTQASLFTDPCPSNGHGQTARCLLDANHDGCPGQVRCFFCQELHPCACACHKEAR